VNARAKVPLVVPVRWGAKEVRNITVDPLVGIATVTLSQFVDLKLYQAPQLLALALYAVTTSGPAGLSVRWTVSLGCGSTSHDEVFSVPVDDALVQAPTLLQRSANSVQIQAAITSMAAGTKSVKLVALISPVSPTWITEVLCDVPVKEGNQ